jgi:GNAT superfamily N-acetyltransferase
MHPTERLVRDGFTWTLRDGSPVWLQPVTASDRDCLRDGFSRLSRRTIYQRFFRDLTRLDDRTLDAFTDVDQVEHVAWSARDLTVPDMPGLALGRFIRDAEDPSVAEVAFTVVDSHQRRGLGTLLMAVLTLRAEALGVRTLRAFTLPDNEAVDAWLRGFGAETRSNGLLRELDIPIGGESRLPPTPALERFMGLLSELRPHLDGF